MCKYAYVAYVCARVSCLLLVNFLENVLEAAIVLLQDGVLGAEIQRPLLLQREPEAAVRKVLDRLRSTNIIVIIGGESNYFRNKL